jgi:hypothetical protein
MELGEREGRALAQPTDLFLNPVGKGVAFKPRKSVPPTILRTLSLEAPSATRVAVIAPAEVPATRWMSGRILFCSSTCKAPA